MTSRGRSHLITLDGFVLRKDEYANLHIMFLQNYDYENKTECLPIKYYDEYQQKSAYVSKKIDLIDRIEQIAAHLPEGSKSPISKDTKSFKVKINHRTRIFNIKGNPICVNDIIQNTIRITLRIQPYSFTNEDPEQPNDKTHIFGVSLTAGAVLLAN